MVTKKLVEASKLIGAEDYKVLLKRAEQLHNSMVNLLTKQLDPDYTRDWKVIIKWLTQKLRKEYGAEKIYFVDWIWDDSLIVLMQLKDKSIAYEIINCGWFLIAGRYSASEVLQDAEESLVVKKSGERLPKTIDELKEFAKRNARKLFSGPGGSFKKTDEDYTRELINNNKGKFFKF